MRYNTLNMQPLTGIPSVCIHGFCDFKVSRDLSFFPFSLTFYYSVFCLFLLIVAPSFE